MKTTKTKIDVRINCGVAPHNDYKNGFKQSENLMPIHISTSPMESTLSNSSYLPNVICFLAFFTSFVCTCVLTTFFFESCFVHIVLGVKNILVICGKLCHLSI